MTCARARRLFGACWDDEITQGEREWLDAHLSACANCRKEYEALARTLEAVASLPREEAAPDLLERTLARARRAAPAPDRLPETRRPWVPITATAAAAVLVLTVVAPWTGWMSGVPGTDMVRTPASDVVPEPVAVARPVTTQAPAEPGAEVLPELAAGRQPVRSQRGRRIHSRSRRAAPGPRASAAGDAPHGRRAGRAGGDQFLIRRRG